MENKGIIIENRPESNAGVLVAGFTGWGNALEISSSMMDYLIKGLGAVKFARLNTDLYCRYIEERPVVRINDGALTSISHGLGELYFADSTPNNIVILKAQEPALRWFHFTEALLSLCGQMGIRTIVTIGSMYDNVLHNDRIMSAVSSNEELSLRLKEKGILPISYEGPCSIHTIVQSEGEWKGFECASIWCHCPYYLQGTTHYGILSHLGSFLSGFFGFDLDLTELNTLWKELKEKIQEIIDNNGDLQDMIARLRKEKVRGSWAHMKEDDPGHDKVLDIRDFMKPR